MVFIPLGYVPAGGASACMPVTTHRIDRRVRRSTAAHSAAVGEKVVVTTPLVSASRTPVVEVSGKTAAELQSMRLLETRPGATRIHPAGGIR